MCLIALAWRVDPKLRLVVAANRDERHDRPAAPLARWQDKPSIIAGRDLEQGGTWMGVTEAGRFAAITNYREIQPPPPDALSRGSIVTDFLESDREPEEWLQSLRERSSRFAGFNLLVATGENLGFLSNRSEHVRGLEAGIYGLSNGPWDANWPKVVTAIEGMRQALRGDALEEDLFTLLRDESGARDDHLPDTGVGIATERFLSPIFIRSVPYGTRCSTVLSIGNDGSIRIREKSWTPAGELERESDWSGG